MDRSYEAHRKLPPLSGQSWEVNQLLCFLYATVVLEKEKELVVKVLDLMLFGSESPQQSRVQALRRIFYFYTVGILSHWSGNYRGGVPATTGFDATAEGAAGA